LLRPSLKSELRSEELPTMNTMRVKSRVKLSRA